MERKRTARWVPGATERNLPQGVEPLTHREMEILQQLATGETNRRIGEALCLSTKTVEYHVRHIFEKLGVTNRTRAVVKAEQLGLVVPLNGGNGEPDGTPLPNGHASSTA